MIEIAILGATGMVGQRLVTLLADHPWFRVVALAASAESAGKTYAQAVQGRWTQAQPLPESLAQLKVADVFADVASLAGSCRLAFCALSLSKDKIRQIEEEYAQRGVMVVSNNSAHRWTEDVPMLLPEVNAQHLALLTQQRTRRGWSKGGIVVKPNCSIQAYVPVFAAWKDFGVERAIICTAQAASGAGKSLTDWPELADNVIPLIAGEEEKSEREPLKVLGSLSPKGVILADKPRISATCLRVPVSDGHMASVSVQLARKASPEELIAALEAYRGAPEVQGLPSAPKQLLTYFRQEDRPQTRLDRDLYTGMGISVGRLRPDSVFDYSFICLAHNTLRGAAGGALLTAELVAQAGYLE
jgi:aspartate-semialdehyde dehydrogenase